jgi:hypothetical protein
MNGALPSLSLYAFMACTGTAFSFYVFRMSGCHYSRPYESTGNHRLRWFSVLEGKFSDNV